MQFSKRSTYSLRAMGTLAKNWDVRPLPLSHISAEQKISKKFLEHIFSDLKNANLIKARRGSEGGYLLQRSPDKISIHEIVRAVEGDIKLTRCITEDGNTYCSNKKNCGVVAVLSKIQKDLIESLKETKLSEVAKNTRRQI